MKNLITGILTLTFAALGQAQPANPARPADTRQCSSGRPG